jgi:TatA/E family protein of Tat protein translocase
MIANIAGVDGVVVLLVALVVLVGGSQLPKIARNVGLAGKEFRKAQHEAEEEQRQHAAAEQTQPAAPPPKALPAGSPSSGAGERSINLSPAELEALLKAREEQARREAN